MIALDVEALLHTVWPLPVDIIVAVALLHSDLDLDF